MRLWPTLAFVAFFQLTLYKFVVDTPYYYTIDEYRRGCETDIWKTLLFFNNYAKPKVRYMCKTLYEFSMTTRNLLGT